MLETLTQATSDISLPIWLCMIFTMLLMSGAGVPVPEEIPLLFLSILYYQEQISGPVWIVLAILAVSLADFCLYTIGKYLGLKIFQHPFFKRSFNESAMQKVNHYIHTFGYKVIILGRLVLGVRSAIFLSAGILRMSREKFILYDLIASTISVSLFMFLSNRLLTKFDGEFSQVQQTIKHYQSYLTFAAALVAVTLIGFAFVRYYKSKAKA